MPFFKFKNEIFTFVLQIFKLAIVFIILIFIINVINAIATYFLSKNTEKALFILTDFSTVWKKLAYDVFGFAKEIMMTALAGIAGTAVGYSKGIAKSMQDKEDKDILG